MPAAVSIAHSASEHFMSPPRLPTDELVCLRLNDAKEHIMLLLNGQET